MIGRTVSHYRIVEKIGRGGMGVVYKAEDLRLGRPVALKFLHADLLRHIDAKSRFLTEARAASALDHPHICTVYEIGESEEEGLFLALAWYDGESLRERIRRGPLPTEDAARFARQIAEALAAAHDKGIVHRDVKPANIMLAEDRSAKLLDFGLAKLIGSDGPTRTGTTVGTVSYMAPEQVRGEEADHRADIWALGVVLYEMLAGRLPFRGGNERAVFHSILEVPHEPVEKIRPDAPPDLVRVVNRCLVKNRSGRCSDAREAARDLALAEGSSEATSIWRRPGGGGRRRLAPVIALAAVAAIALGLWAGRGTIRSLAGGGPLPENRYTAVLPCRSDEEDRALCLGLSRYLAFGLERVEPFTSEFRVFFGEDTRTLESARRLLAVDLALDGELRRAGGGMEISVRLRDARTGRSLRSFTLRGAAGNLAVLQDTLLLRTVEMLGLPTGAPARAALAAGRTSVPAAFEPFLRGIGFLSPSDGEAEPDSAVRWLETAIAEDPGYALAHAAIAEAGRLAAENAEDPIAQVGAAALRAERAIRLDDRLTLPRITLARIAIHAGDEETAIRHLTDALDRNPADDQALRLLAYVREITGDPTRAELVYRRAVELRPGDHWMRCNLAFFFLSRGRYEEAAEEYRRVARIAPENPSGYSHLGVAYNALGRWEEARDAFLRSIEIEPNYGALANLATLYFTAERYADAAETYGRTLAIDSTDYRVWGNLASCLSLLPDREEEKRLAYERAARLAEERRRKHPKDARLIAHIAEYYDALGEPERALPLVENAIALAPDDVEVMFHAAHTYEKLGHRDQALEWIGRAVRNGYDVSLIEETPGLRDLTADPRYREIVGGAAKIHDP
ncbi:MAG: protein kinase [Candidatus Eisenbacteria bacterium]|nr:protein kinase [Candidatus Eisenbacteria bacterium]